MFPEKLLTTWGNDNCLTFFTKLLMYLVHSLYISGRAYFQFVVGFLFLAGTKGQTLQKLKCNFLSAYNDLSPTNTWRHVYGYHGEISSGVTHIKLIVFLLLCFQFEQAMCNSLQNKQAHLDTQMV